MTPNQVVAHHMRRIRLRRGWTQSEAAERIGLGWSKATYSAAERSVTGRRIKHFDADEIVRMADAFGVHPMFFFARAEPYMVRGDLLERTA